MNLIEHKEEIFYIDASGLAVFTEAYHLERGYCCGHGCRHCPYQYEAVQEPKKSKLLATQKLSIAGNKK